MAPTLRPGDVLVVEAGRLPDVGDLVVVRWPGQPVAVKRLLTRERDGGWFVERDSRTVGIDSLSHGPVPQEGLLATVLARLWPRPGACLGRPEA